MFRSARWRSEKNRIKVVFRLQLHATQVPQLNGEGLTLSLVPWDVGKPTLKLEKVVVQEGCYWWESPVYETVRFVQDAKTGKVFQRIYHLIVSTTGSGTARARPVGEASIDFADYVNAFKTCNVSLPLRNSNSKAMLHVTIQRQLREADTQREVDESERLEKQSRDHGLKSHLGIKDVDESHESDLKVDGPFDKASQISELRHKIFIEPDGTISSFDSVSELNAPREVGSREDKIQRNHHSFSTSLGHPTLLLRSATSMSEEPHVSESEWSGFSDHRISTDDSMNSLNDTIPRNISSNAALTRQADLSKLELQSLRKQMVKESKRNQYLLREVTILTQERDSLKAECEKLKASEKRKDEMKMRNKLQSEGSDPWILLEEIRQELDCEKDLNSNLRLQIQKTQVSNTKLILAVQDLEVMLEQRDNKAANLSSGPGTCEKMEESSRWSLRSDTDEDEDLKALEELVKGDTNAKDTPLMKQKITELYNDVEIYRRDKDELEIQLEQLLLDYEILKQENHDISYKLKQNQLLDQLKMQYECSPLLVNVSELENQVESLEAELRKQSKEFSECLRRVKELETQNEGLEEELEKQAQLFEADIEAVTRAKVEQEQRAIQAEESLRKTRWNNASVAEKLQEEFKRLSVKLASTFEANKKMAMRAMTEANELFLQKHKLEEMLKDANDELQTTRTGYEAKLLELSELVNLKTNEAERMLEKLDEKSKRLNNQMRHEEDVTAELTQEMSRMEGEGEVESLRKDKNALVVQLEQAENQRLELEKMRKSVKEAEASLESGNTERNELSSTIASMEKDSQTLVEELHELKCVKDENEATIQQLQGELETVRAECDDLKLSLSENESEIEDREKLMAQLKRELKNKEEAVANLEKKLKEGEQKVGVLNAGEQATFFNMVQ